MIALEGRKRRKKRPRKRALVGSKPVALMRLVEVDEVEEILEYVPEEQLSVEMKFNGWLTQWVAGKLYTRRGKDLTRKFPHIVDTLRNYPRTHLLGELVYWDAEGVMDEPAVTHVAGTKDPREAREKLEAMPGRFELALFDMLSAEGKDLTGLATHDRVGFLQALIPSGDEVKVSEVFEFKDWEGVYADATALGGDGVVFKNLEAPYIWRPLGQTEARPTGFWWKLKPIKTDDFVVYDVARGPKGSLLVLIGQYWRGELVPIGKFNNFSAEVEADILERIEEGPFVMEVAFQSRFPKPPGRLQHPRLERFREDKGPEQVELPARYAPR